MNKGTISENHISKKKSWQTILSVFLFLLVFSVLFRYVYEVTRLKDGSYEFMGGFYKEPENTLDVVFVGSSHMYRGISPMHLWESEGIASYVTASPSQTIPTSYYVIKEVLDRQEPKVIIWDVYGSYYRSCTPNTARIHPITDVIPWYNMNRVRMFLEYLIPNSSYEKWKELAFPFLIYHNRWDDLGKEDFYHGACITKGGTVTFETVPGREPPEYDSTSCPQSLFLEYLEKVIALCQKKGVELILCAIPMADYEKYAFQRGRMRYFMEYGEKLGAKVLDLQTMTEETGIDFTTDFMNVTHLNINGSYKMTEFFGRYLKEQYMLPDHRGEARYKQWDVQLVDYQDIYHERKSNSPEEEDNGLE